MSAPDDQTINKANNIADSIQDFFGIGSMLAPKPVSEAIDSVNVVIDIQQDVNEYSGISTWKIMVASVAGNLASAPYFVVGQGTTFAAALAALGLGGPLGVVGSVAIIYSGTVATFEITENVNDATRNSVLNALTSPGYMKLDNSVSSTVIDFVKSTNTFLDETSGWSKKPDWLNNLITATNVALFGVGNLDAFIKASLTDLIGDTKTISSYFDSLYDSATENEITYGTENSDDISTTNLVETIVSGAGDDVISSKGGDDIIYAGTGNDSINAGSGNDIIYGGKGLDTYTFSGGYGSDVVIDSDNSGRIVMNGRVITGSATFVSTSNNNSLYQLQLNGKTYDLVISSNSTDLLLRDTNDSTNFGVIIKNFANGNLGLALEDADNNDPNNGADKEASASDSPDDLFPNYKDYYKDWMDEKTASGQSISPAFQTALNALLQSQNNPPAARVDPLTLDLDGDGVELISLSNSTAFFDLDVTANLDENGDFDGTYTSDGTKEQVGWVKADDGILALDKNSNGTIDNILELFGKSNKTGTEELREYDLNNDGVINSSDAVFSELKIWQDANGNGISESGELKTLADHGITSINLNNLTTKNESNGGNIVISEGTYTKTIINSEGNSEEVTRTYNNLDLAVNQANSVAYEYTDPDGNTTGDYDLNLEALFLPFIRGYGNVDALPVAASKNETLLTQLQELRDLTPTEYNTINAKVEQILYQWTGTSSISDEAMRGSYSAKKLAVLEAMRGEAYVFNGESGDVPAARAGLVELAWTTVFNDIKSKLLVQSTFKDIFSHTDGEEIVYATYDFVTDSLNYNGLTADELFTNITNSITSITSSESTASDSEVAARINEAYAAVTQDHFRTEITKLLNIILNSSSNNITDLTYANLSEKLAELNSGEMDKIYANSDNTAEDHDSIITNRTGDDTLYGLRGDDTYVFNIGDGKDTIDESAGVTTDTDFGTDTILMGAGISKDDVYISGDAAYTIIKFKSNSTDQITILRQDADYNKVETILFSNGDIIDLTDPDLKYNFYGTNSNDTLNGSNDADILSGEQGNDIIQGANGNDTYIFSRGDGQDVIAEYGVFSVSSKYDTGSIAYGTSAAGSDANISLGTDTIQFEAGITESDLTFFISGSDLHIGISDSPSDLIIIKDHFNGVANRIENLKFTNEAGETTILDLTTKDWLTMTLTTTGTPQDDVINASLGDDVIYSEGGNDTINAGLGNDLLNGGTGNDALNGGEGSDIYEFNLGDGEDTITDSANGDDENKIVFGIGISASNLVFTRGSGVGSNNDLIVTFTNSPDDKITIKNFVYSESSLKYFEFTIDNGDGTTSTTQVEAKSLIAGFTYSGTEGADIVNSTNNASNYNDTVNLLGGNDTAYTQAGNDMLIGGTGNDYLAGGRGNDTYVFNAGDGEDSISEIGYSDNLILESYEDNGSDTIQLGAGITKDDLIFAVEQGNLVITFKTYSHINISNDNEPELALNKFLAS